MEEAGNDEGDDDDDDEFASFFGTESPKSLKRKESSQSYQKKKKESLKDKLSLTGILQSTIFDDQPDDDESGSSGLSMVRLNSLVKHF